MIFLEVSGDQYSNFTEASVSFSMDTFSREFRFTATASEGQPLPFKGGEPCKIFIDEDQVLDGFIDIIDISYEGESHSIDILGRGKTADLLDSTIDEEIELSAEISLADAIRAVISHLKLNIEVDDLVGDLEIFNVAEDKIGASTGEGAFEFIETLARKRQVMLNENGKGNIEIVRASTIMYQQKLQNIVKSDSNNIKRGGASFDLTGIYNLYVARSQQNTVALNFSGSSDLSQSVDQSGRSTDGDVREGRQFIFLAEKASSNEQLQARTDWESNIRRARSRLYNVTIVGHQTSFNEQWTLNKLISVNDEFTGIQEEMLVNQIVFIEGVSDGEIVELGLIDKNAYTPNPADTFTDEVGGEFVF